MVMQGELAGAIFGIWLINYFIKVHNSLSHLKIFKTLFCHYLMNLV